MLTLLKPNFPHRHNHADGSSHDSFARRLNNDATIDSICPRCFVTVGQSLREADLERAEQSHVCNSWRIEYYRGMRKALEEYRKGKGERAPEN